MSEDAQRHLRALKAYKEHTGKEYVPKSSPHDPASMKDFTFMGLDRTYGDSWCRPGLDLRTKSFICMTLTAALGCDDQLRSHITAAHASGVTKDEIVDWLIHMNGYAGTPRANVALKIAREVWKDMAEPKAPAAR
jgi:4-carboxymuconolactone decarboxylase